MIDAKKSPSNIQDILKNAQLTGDVFVPENFVHNEEIPDEEENDDHLEKISGYEEDRLQRNIAKQEIITEHENIFSVENVALIRQKRDMQNKVNAVADEMGVEEQDKQKLLLSYLTLGKLNAKMKAQKNEQDSNAYGVNLEHKAIEEFVRQKTQENVSYSDENQGKKKKKKGSQKSGKNASMRRNSNKKKKKGMSGFQKGLIATSGFMGALSFFT